MPEIICGSILGTQAARLRLYEYADSLVCANLKGMPTELMIDAYTHSVSFLKFGKGFLATLPWLYDKKLAFSYCV